MRLTIDRPRPVEGSPPVGRAERRWKRSNSRAMSSGASPGPWSATRITVRPLFVGDADLDAAAGRAVLDGVAQEIVDRLAHAVGIADA